MKLNNSIAWKMLGGAVAAALVLAPTTMFAGTVILEGSDAIGLHCSQGGTAGACVYENQTWKALDGASGLPIAAIGSVSSVGSDGSGITVDNFATVAAAAAAGKGGLSQYAALYFISSSGCCTEDDTLPSAPGAAAAISSYLSGGGTIMIENYDGGAAWDFAVGTKGGATGAVAGIGGTNPATSDNCDDGEKVTAVGKTNGFTQPPAIGCWEHQAYQESVFAPLGFTLSFFDAAPGMVSGATTGWSGLLSMGTTITGSAPEPSTFLLIGGALATIGLKVRRRRSPRVG